MNQKLGVICDENWIFINDILNRLSEKYEIRKFDGLDTDLKMIPGHKVIKKSFEKRFYNKNKINSIMKWSDIAFFEWASRFLEIGTHLPKNTPIITRLHRYEVFEFGNRIDWSKVDKLITVGEGIRRWIVERTDIDEAKIDVIYNSVDTDLFNPLPIVVNLQIGLVYWVI